MIQALAMAVYGTNIGFGLTPAQALQPNSFTAGGGRGCGVRGRTTGAGLYPLIPLAVTTLTRPRIRLWQFFCAFQSTTRSSQ